MLAESPQQTQSQMHAHIESFTVGECICAVERPESIAEFIGWLGANPEAFIRFFLEEKEQIVEVPAFHIDLFMGMTSTTAQRSVFALPRDHAKTTIAKLAAVWYLLFTPYRFVLYTSTTSTVAVSAVQDIIGLLHTRRSIELFGKPVYEIERPGEGLVKFKLPMLNKTCIIRALGSGQQVRGVNVDHQRPELLIADDIETNENTATEGQLDALRRWFYGPLRKALDAQSWKIIQLGNMITAKGLLHLHCHSPRWYSRLFGAILSNGQPLWPGRFTLEGLLNEYREYAEAGMAGVWLAEMMNLVVENPLSCIKASEITMKPAIKPLDGSYSLAFITIDPAISNARTADCAAVVVHVQNAEGQWQIVEESHQRGLDGAALFLVAYRLAAKWGACVWGVEAVAYQQVLLGLFQMLLRTEGVIDGTVEVLPLRAGRASKTTRILAWAGALKQKHWVLTAGDLYITQQLIAYNPLLVNNKDDTIDACAYGLQMVTNYAHIISRHIIGMDKEINEPYIGLLEMQRATMG